MQAGIYTKAVHRAVQARLQKRLDHLLGRRIGMQIHRYVQCLARLIDGPVALRVVILAQRMTVEDHGLETQLFDTALYLAHGAVGIVRRHRYHAGVTIRMRVDGCR